MLTRETFAGRFGRRPVIGMVHLAPLPGAPLYGGDMSDVVESALRDADALRQGGCDALMFENFGDRPFVATHVESETVAAMTRVITEVVATVVLPFGVNVLRNDASAALAIAAATGAAFIRVNVHTGSMLTDQGMIEGEAAATLRKRSAIAPSVAIFADHLVKHAFPPPGTDPVQAAKDLRHRGLADAIIVSGAETGSAPDPARLHELRRAVEAPILIGSGLDEQNAAAWAGADGAIVGTSIKRDGRVDAPVDAERVARVVAAFRR